MVEWMHEFLQLRHDRKCGVEREIWARLVKKSAKLLRFWTVRKVVRLVFDTTFWLGSGIFFALKGFPHFKQVFHNFAC